MTRFTVTYCKVQNCTWKNIYLVRDSLFGIVTIPDIFQTRVIKIILRKYPNQITLPDGLPKVQKPTQDRIKLGPNSGQFRSVQGMTTDFPRTEYKIFFTVSEDDEISKFSLFFSFELFQSLLFSVFFNLGLIKWRWLRYLEGKANMARHVKNKLSMEVSKLRADWIRAQWTVSTCSLQTCLLSEFPQEKWP